MGRTLRGASAFASMIMLAACGGGGGGGSTGNSGIIPSQGVPYTAGVYQPRGGLANQCAAPRSGNDPRTGQRWPDRAGSVAAENNFLRSWSNELYLWYRELPDLNPNSTPVVADYFDLLRTSATTPSGQPKDKFHFTYGTNEWIALSQSGVSAGYGVEWMLLSAPRTIPRELVIAYVEPDSPAARANLSRGMRLLSVDGASYVSGNTQSEINTINAGLFPSGAGESHSFVLRDLVNVERPVTMTSAEVTSRPVQNVRTISTPSGPVGYMLFNDHIATSEAALADAITQLRTAGVVDLLLDIRYNGGGYLDIASALGYMIAGAATSGRTFERIQFNDKYPSTNPVTGQPLEATPFHPRGNFGATNGATLPTLNLPQARVYVLTGPGTCSASEAIINGLRGINFTVYQIGSTTCGKPYGFYAQDNCGTTYFSIQFQGVNAADFGAYSDGFSPTNTAGVAGERIPGCSVADDFTRPLGDPAERRLAAALSFRESNNQVCPMPPSGFAANVQTKPGQRLDMADGVMFKSPARENRILRDM